MSIIYHRYIKIFLSVFIVFLFTACESLISPKLAECAYQAKPSKDNVDPEFRSHGVCGEFFDEDTLLIYSKHLDKLDFSKSNLTSLYTDNGIFYVSKSGSVVRTFFFDNGADYFKEGLVRMVKGKKFGFMNKELKVVIAPQYDFAFPFKNGKSIVCNGCEQKKDEQGEHSRMVGGKWGIINKQGNVLVPVEYDSKEVYEKL